MPSSICLELPNITHTPISLSLLHTHIYTQYTRATYDVTYVCVCVCVCVCMYILMHAYFLFEHICMHKFSSGRYLTPISKNQLSYTLLLYRESHLSSSKWSSLQGRHLKMIFSVADLVHDICITAVDLVLEFHLSFRMYDWTGRKLKTVTSCTN